MSFGQGFWLCFMAKDKNKKWNSQLRLAEIWLAIILNSITSVTQIFLQLAAISKKKVQSC